MNSLRLICIVMAVAISSLPTAWAEMIVISEIMYHPAGDRPEYFILSNQTSTPFDLARWRVAEGVNYTFPEFARDAAESTFLKAHEAIVLSSAEPTATQRAYGWPASRRVYGPWAGTLSDEGERLTVEDKNGVVICSLRYGTEGHWPAGADGTGYSLVLKPDRNRNATAKSWTIRSAVSPSIEGNVRSTAKISELEGKLQLNELHFSSPDGIEWVELFNRGSNSVDLRGFFLASRPDFSDRLPLEGVMKPGAVRSHQATFPVAKGRVTVFLLAAGGGILDCVRVRPPTGQGYQRYPDGGTEWYDADQPTRDTTNNPARETNIVINEIMFDPPDGGQGSEYVELFNRGPVAVNLSGWQLGAGIDFHFPDGASIAPSGFLVVAKNITRMRELYGAIPLVGNFSRKLSADGELLRLLDRLGNLIDEVDYRTGGDWPVLSRGHGSSLELVHPQLDRSLGSAWRDSDESTRSAFRTYTYTNQYLELKTPGAPSDYRELHLYLVSAGHVVLRNIELRQNGTNLLVHSSQISTNGSGNTGWLCQGTHAGTFLTNGELHLVADGAGDNRANRIEIDLPGLRPNEMCELRFEARWFSSQPRLIARTFDGSVEGSFLIGRPANVGTPGSVNSRGLANPPPQIADLTHTPVVPTASDTVRVSVRISSVAPLERVELWHRPDSTDASWSVQPMHAETAADRGGVVYGGNLASYRKNGQVVQFFVRAVVQNGQAAQSPLGGSTAPALYVVDDRALTNGLRTVRLVMSAHDLGAMEAGGTAPYDFKYPRLSKHSFNATFISDDREICYGAEVKNTGSPLTRDGQLKKPSVKLPRDRPFRHRTRFLYDNDAAAGIAYHNRVVRYLLYQLGQAPIENEFVRLIINAGPVVLREELEPVGKEFLARAFPRGQEGDLYKIGDEWWFIDDGDGQMQDADWTYRGPGAAPYRNSWAKRTNKREDDFSALSDFFQLVSATNYAQSEIEERLDPKATLQVAAMRGLIGDWDNFTMQRGRNGYFYRRPGDGRFQLIHWDSDEGFLTGPPLYGRFIKEWLERSYNRERFFGYVDDLIAFTVRSPERFSTWLALEQEATGDTVYMASYRNFFQVRAAEIREQLPKRELHVGAVGSEASGSPYEP